MVNLKTVIAILEGIAIALSALDKVLPRDPKHQNLHKK